MKTIEFDADDKAIEYFTKCNEEMKEIAPFTLILKDDLKELQDKIQQPETDVDIYKNLSKLRQERIDKAIEYIENTNKYSNLRRQQVLDELLEILKGEDKE